MPGLTNRAETAVAAKRAAGVQRRLAQEAML
jgi:hypothetical protein